MTGDVIDFAQARAAREENQRGPYWAGEAKCVSCKHEWAACAPLDAQWVECPGCGLNMGRPKHPFGPGNDEMQLECNCGCDVFFVGFNKARGSYVGCAGCGQDMTGALDARFD